MAYLLVRLAELPHLLTVQTHLSHDKPLLLAVQSHLLAVPSFLLMEEDGAIGRIESLPCPACYLPVWCSDLSDVVL
jgi:hypothetical protein